MDCQAAPSHIIRDSAAASYGVVSRVELLAAGVPAAVIDHRLHTGVLPPIHRGVYAVGHTALLMEGRWLAAVRAVGPGAVLSHQHAAALWDLDHDPAAPPVHVTLGGRAGRIRHAGIVIHRPRRLDAEDLTTHRRIPVTTVARTLLDLASFRRGRRLEQTVRGASRARLFDRTALEAVLDRYPHHRGRRELGRVLAAMEDRGTEDLRSVLEALFLQSCDDAGVAAPVVNGHVLGERVDFHWPQAKLVVEVDGYVWHDTPTDFAEDRRRDQRLVVAGWRVVRFTYDDVRRHRRRVVATVMTLLNRGTGAA